MLKYRLGLYDFEPAPKGLEAPWIYKREDRAVTRDWRAAYAHRGLADAATAQRLDTLKADDDAKLWPSWAMDADYHVPMPDGEALFPYQKAGVAFAMAREATLIADDPRLGKSAQACGVFNKMHARRMLIVCPASAKPQWRKYVERWCCGAPVVKVVQGLSDTISGDVIIINWDILQYYTDALGAFDVAVFDECRAMKNEKAARTKAAKSIAATRRLFLDGTPISVRPFDLWPIVRECDRWGLGKSRADFAKRYCDAEKSDGSWDPDGAINLEELQRRMRQTFMIRREKTDVAGELTSTRQMVWLPNDGLQEALDAERSALVGDDTRPLFEILEAWADSPAPEGEGLASARQALAQAKLVHVYDYVDRLLESSQKVVVFGYHRAITLALAERYPGSALVIGGVTPAARQSAIDRFQSDPACRVFVGNITACNSAISLAAADDVVYAELSWIPTEMAQSEERIWLPGKAAPLTMHWLMFEDSLDAAMHTIVLQRLEHLSRALNRAALEAA